MSRLGFPQQPPLRGAAPHQYTCFAVPPSRLGNNCALDRAVAVDAYPEQHPEEWLEVVHERVLASLGLDPVCGGDLEASRAWCVTTWTTPHVPSAPIGSLTGTGFRFGSTLGGRPGAQALLDDLEQCISAACRDQSSSRWVTANTIPSRLTSQHPQ